jgi:hypothetical protein
MGRSEHTTSAGSGKIPAPGAAFSDLKRASKNLRKLEAEI